MPEKEFRPWGFYIVLADEEKHKVKQITVFPGKRLSLQRHKLRAEHWHFIAGKGEMTLDVDIFPVHKGESVDIPREAIHRIENNNAEDLSFIEIQTGDYFGEDDIERLEDDFGRAGK